MKSIAALLLFAMSAAPKEYPVHVHLKQVQTHTMRESRTESVESSYAEGIAIVDEDGKPSQEFDFVFHNCNRPSHSGTVGFPGRWKNPKELIILIPAQDGKPDECTLKLKPRDTH